MFAASSRTMSSGGSMAEPLSRGAVVRLLDDRLEQRDEDRAQAPLLSDRRAEVEGAAAVEQVGR